MFFDRVEQDGKNSVVIIDNYKCGYQATKHLIEQGCKRIVHIAGKQTSSVYIDRLNGYKKALADHKIRFHSNLVLLRGVDAEAAPLLVMDILSMSPLPDAIFAVNDLCAVLCMKLLQQSGLKIPEDIAFVGFNNDVISTLVEPNLTTVNYSGMEIGAIAGKAIIDEIKGASKTKNNLTITLHAELIVRDSSMKSKAIQDL